MENTTPDVLVVGAGPTGLTLACEILRHGRTCRLIDELDAPVTFSKAAVVHSRTMEAFDTMGLAAGLVAEAKVVHGLNVFANGKRVAHVALKGVDSPFPHPYGISQQETERALTAHLASLGGAVERGKRLEHVSETTEGVIATLASGETIGARWIVGCDGAHSVVRKEMGCAFEGAPYEERLVQADVHVEIPGAIDDEIMIYLHEDGPILLFPLFRDGRYRLIVLLPAGAPALEPTLDVFQHAVDARGPKGAKVSDPAWMVGFSIHHRRTSHYRKGRAFVAGDAAHIHSPVGGQGMNTGIQDAYNLAWKLALVSEGAAHESILDSYEAERAPIAKALLETTDRAMHGLELIIGLRNPIATALRNQLVSFVTSFSVVQERAARTLSMLTVGYPGSPIVRQDRVQVWQASALISVASEQPNLSDWAAFGEAPGPGERAVDAVFGGPEDGHLFDLFRSPRHVALLFDGATGSAEGYAYLERVGRRLRDRLGAFIDVHLVVPHATKPAEVLWDGPVVLDAKGAVHQRYGARSECLYLIRPDGYVAYRSQPADEARLFEFLATIFRGA
jgi:2-polyprenyl-6-methoxyphenol hydroxylase-like FAD-dependent oxidoreductase